MTVVAYHRFRPETKVGTISRSMSDAPVTHTGNADVPTPIMEMARKKNELIADHPDGRLVHASIFGARDFARVIVYSHGFPACRHEAFVAHEVARETGFTIVAIDRPGFGGSHWYGERKLEDWAHDVQLVTDRLGIERFALLGVSGGAPTAIAAAAALKERVSSLTIVSGVAPMHLPDALEGMNLVSRLIVRLGVSCSPVARASIAGLATSWRLAPAVADLWFATLLPKSDREILMRRDVGLVLARTLQEALRNGVRGVVTEFELLLSKWEGLLRRVEVPAFVWHGDADNYVPIAMGRVLSREIQGSAFTTVEGGGHFMVIDKLPEILRAVV